MYIESKQALAEELELKRPAVLAVSGAHNSGKTTLLEKLLPVLRSRGLKVGIIKHDGHDFTPDVPGTDSFRLREAGAEGVAVYSGTRYLLTEEFRLTEQDLLALGEPWAPGKIYDANGIQNAARLRQLGFVVRRRHCSDDPARIAAELEELLTGCDAVITSGGVSVGQKDYLPVVLEMLGTRSIFAGVAQKPGSPMLAAEVEGKLVFCLSGNPFAAAATLEQYAVPALLRAAGRQEEACILPRTRRTLTTGFSKPSKGNRYLRARASGSTVAIPGEGNTEAHSSGSLSAMIGCNSLVELPAGSGPVEPGEEVEVLSFVY